MLKIYIKKHYILVYNHFTLWCMALVVHVKKTYEHHFKQIVVDN